jgi:hypothetical protein
MTDPLARELADRVAAAIPTTVPSFDDVLRRARRQRLRNTIVIAASAAVVAGIAVGGWALRGTDPELSPAPPVSTPSQMATTSSAPDPTPNESTSPGLPEASPDPDYPSGIVVRLPGGDVEMPAETSCWKVTEPEDCRMGLSGEWPDLGTRDVIEFRFAKPGWEFWAVFRNPDQDCGPATTVQAIPTGDRWFRLDPAGAAGQYDVSLSGSGPGGLSATRFLWTTTSNGQIDPPLGTVGLFANSRGVGSFALEVVIDDLPFQPDTSELSSVAEVVVTGANGSQRTLRTPLIPQSLDCVNGHYFYYQGEWDDDFSTLGGSPFDLEITLSIRGTTYIGHANWRKIKGEASMAPISFTPPLPNVGAN